MSTLCKEQDKYTGDQVAEMFSKGLLEKGSYQVDIGGNEDVKISKIQRRWIQKEDIAEAITQ